MRTAYGSDLAFIHQAGFNAVATHAAQEIIAALRKTGRKDAHVLDLGCGSGELLREVTQAGFRGTGIDASPAFIKRARKAAPQAEFRLGSLHETPFPPCDAVSATGEVLNYMSEGRRKGPALLPLFRRIATALEPGGLFLFDLIMPSPRPALSGRSWRVNDDPSGEGWAVLVHAEENTKARLLKRQITAFRQKGKGWRRTDECHVQYLYTREEAGEALRHAGFRFRVARRYGTFDLLPRRLAFFARKEK